MAADPDGDPQSRRTRHSDCVRGWVEWLTIQARVVLRSSCRMGAASNTPCRFQFVPVCAGEKKRVSRGAARLASAD